MYGRCSVLLLGALQYVLYFRFSVWRHILHSPPGTSTHVGKLLKVDRNNNISIPTQSDQYFSHNYYARLIDTKVTNIDYWIDNIQVRWENNYTRFHLSTFREALLPKLIKIPRCILQLGGKCREVTFPAAHVCVCVNNCPKVGSLSRDLRSRKSTALTTTPPGHTNPAQLVYIRWQWRNFVLYLCQLTFVAIL